MTVANWLLKIVFDTTNYKEMTIKKHVCFVRSQRLPDHSHGQLGCIRDLIK